MGLKQNYKDKFTGVEVPDAYYKVIEINKNFLNKHAHITVGLFHTKELSDSGLNPSHSEAFILHEKAQFITKDHSKNASVDNVIKVVPAFDEFFSIKDLSRNGNNDIKQSYKLLKEYVYPEANDVLEEDK